MHYRGIQEGTGCKDYRPTIRKKAVRRSVWGMGTISKRGREKQAVRDTPGGLPANCVWPGRNFRQGYKMQHPEMSDNYWAQNGESCPESCHKLGGE